MKRLISTHHLRCLGVAAVLLVACAGPASANPLSSGTVDFTNGQGTLTGFFQLNTATGQVTNWDFTTSAFNCADLVACVSSGFPKIEYTPANSTADIGFSFQAQAITFTTTVFNVHSVLAFVMNCGGNNNDCIGTAALGSSIPLFTAGESRSSVPIARDLSLASLDVTDPPGTFLSFNVVSRANPAPEPATALLLVPALGALALLRRERKKGSHVV